MFWPASETGAEEFSFLPASRFARASSGIAGELIRPLFPTPPAEGPPTDRIVD